MVFILDKAPSGRSMAQRLAMRKRPRKRRPRLASRVRTLEASKERKIIDTQLTSSASGTAPGLVQLTNLAQGNTDTTRIGNKIMITGIQFRYLVTDTVHNVARVMIIQDKQTNGAIFAATQVLDDISAGDAIVSLRNRDEVKRFRVIHDAVHQISLTGQDSRYVSKFVKLKIPVKYDANAGTIADIVSNSLALMHVSFLASTAITAFVRVFYTDS